MWRTHLACRVETRLDTLASPEREKKTGAGNGTQGACATGTVEVK